MGRVKEALCLPYYYSCWRTNWEKYIVANIWSEAVLYRRVWWLETNGNHIIGVTGNKPDEHSNSRQEKLFSFIIAIPCQYMTVKHLCVENPASLPLPKACGITVPVTWAGELSMPWQVMQAGEQPLLCGRELLCPCETWAMCVMEGSGVPIEQLG